MPTTELEEGDFQDGKIDILAVLVKGGQASSRSEARRAVTQGGVSVDGEKITDIATAYVPADFEGEGKIVKKGKKNFVFFHKKTLYTASHLYTEFFIHYYLAD